MPDGVLHVGLTGGIATGKSYVTQRLAEAGLPTIDADRLAAYRLPSGLASTITAVSPLVVMAVARLAIGERQPRATLIAAVGGVAGVALLVWQSDRSGPVDALGVAAALGAMTSASVGFVLVKRWTAPGEVLATTAWQLVAGGLVLLPLAVALEGAPPALDVPATLALGYLGLVGSLLGYALWFRGLTRMRAGAVAVVGLVNPVVGTTLGRTHRPHLLEAWGHRFNLQLEEHLALFRYRDVPGMVGRVGTAFGRHGINISSAAVGHVLGADNGEAETGADRLAVMVVTADQQVPQHVVDEIAASDGFEAGLEVGLDAAPRESCDGRAADASRQNQAASAMASFLRRQGGVARLESGLMDSSRARRGWA